MPFLTLLIGLFLSVASVDGGNTKSPNQKDLNPPTERPASTPEDPDFIILDVEAP